MVDSPFTGAWDSEDIAPDSFIQNWKTGEFIPLEASALNWENWMAINGENHSWSIGWTTPFLDMKGYARNALVRAETSKEIWRNKKHYDYALAANDQYPVINNYYSVAGIKECRENIRTFIIAVDEGGLILTNIDASNRQVQSIGIAGKTEEEGYLRILQCEFISPYDFKLIQDHFDLKLDDSGEIDVSATTQIRITTQCTINRFGKILKTSKEDFGYMELIQPAVLPE